MGRRQTAPTFQELRKRRRSAENRSPEYSRIPGMKTQNTTSNGALVLQGPDADDKRRQFKDRKSPWQPADWQLGGGA